MNSAGIIIMVIVGISLVACIVIGIMDYKKKGKW